MDFLQDVIDEHDSGSLAGSPRPVTLDIMYDDPELHSLVSFVSSDWDRENLMDSLKQGRLTNDLWALGLSTPDQVTSICAVDDRCCCIQAVVMCDELTDLSSLSDPTNKYTQQLKIKSITVKKEPSTSVESDQSSTSTLPVTSISDYYRFTHLQNGPSSSTLPLASIPPFTPISTWEQTQKNPKPVAALLRTIDVPCKKPEGQGKNTFAIELDLALQTRRLNDTLRELQKYQARVEKLESQLKDYEQHQEHEPVSDKAQIEEDGEGEIPTTSVGHASSEPMVGNDESHSSIATAIEARTIEGDGDDATSELLSCVRCEIRSHSLKLSELHVRNMELRVSMFERRQIENETHAVRLLDALQSERRVRLKIEAELEAERDRRQAAEAMAEAIANEAKWPFVTPNMLDVFLKLQGMVEEVNCEM